MQMRLLPRVWFRSTERPSRQCGVVDRNSKRDTAQREQNGEEHEESQDVLEPS
jgi:hypothetical protein